MPLFGELLSKCIESAGLSPYRLALEARIDGPSLNRVLNGKRRPTDDILKKLADVKQLGITYEQLRVMRAQDEYPEISELSLSDPIACLIQLREKIGPDALQALVDDVIASRGKRGA